LSYPCEVEEKILEWLLTRRDNHLPVGSAILRAKACKLIKPHNPSFLASNGWLDKFRLRHGLSLRCKTTISQKLPAQLENKIAVFLNHVRALRNEHKYPNDLVINMDETPMYFDM
uniref:HTH CENPB-type domain-containing protein n=1 Tax=Amphimedon queenslandica TaxID=400682 RepID=A0A1X7UZJ6_AMPQE